MDDRIPKLVLLFFDSSEKNGFVLDTFVKPPVSIEIVFRQPINIEKIILDAKVNTKISNGFVIFSSIDLREENFSFHQIAKCVNENNPSSCYIYEFLNRRHANNFNDDLKNTTNRTFFSTHSLLYLESVTAVKITISRTLKSTVPCLKSIKIMGVVTEKISQSINEKEAGQTSRDQAKKIVKIPSEFIDEITHEMIRNPIRLPSDKVVDKKTLDTFIDEQKKNNERAKDPFTCVPFSRTYKPIIDELLKSRIDKFLFDNQECVLKFESEINDRNKEISLKRPHSGAEINTRSKMSRLENVSNNSSSKKSETLSVKCNCCLNLKSEKNDFYELVTCKHVFCRHCTKSMDKICILCKKTFENNQIVHLDRKNL